MPVHGHNELKLQEKGSSGQNSAKFQHEELCSASSSCSQRIPFSLQEIYKVLEVGEKRKTNKKNVSRSDIIKFPSCKASCALGSCSNATEAGGRARLEIPAQPAVSRATPPGSIADHQLGQAGQTLQGRTRVPCAHELHPEPCLREPHREAKSSCDAAQPLIRKGCIWATGLRLPPCPGTRGGHRVGTELLMGEQSDEPRGTAASGSASFALARRGAAGGEQQPQVCCQGTPAAKPERTKRAGLLPGSSHRAPGSA